MASHPASPPLTKGSYPSRTKVGFRSRTHQPLAVNHRREDCRFRTHPDFNERGQWDGCLADCALRRWQKDEKEIKLTWGKRANGTVLPWRAPDAAVPAAPPRQNDADDRDQRHRRDNDRRDRDGDRRDHGGCGGRGGRGVQWDKDKGTPCLTSSITHLTCNCGGADINSTYRQYLASMRNTTIYFTALTLYDTGAYTSFVNRVVGAATAWGYICRRAPSQVQQT